MINALDSASFVAAVVKYLNEYPLEWDSEVNIARSLTGAIETVAKSLGLSTEPLLSADGFIFIYCRTQGIWQRVSSDQLITYSQLFDGLFLETTKPKRIKMGWQRSGNIAKSITRLHDIQKPLFFESPTNGIAFTNGFCTVDEFGPEIEDHSPEHAATIAYDFDLDESAEPPENWLKFLDSLWENDGDKFDKIKVLQEFIGGAIAGLSTTFQRALMLIGSGANGKSVLMEIVGELLFPEGTVTHISPRRWDRDYSIAGMLNSRINVVAEIPETQALDSTDLFKSVVSGDRIEARLPYQNPFYLRPSGGQVFSCNEIPRTLDNSHGFYRRFLTLLFNQNFENSPFRRTKEEIKKELSPERSAIILWALHGASRLIRQGDYTRLASHEHTMDEWKKDSDAVFDFANACLNFPSEFKTPLANLREAYQEWARKVGRSPDMGERTLSRRLQKIDELEKGRTSSLTIFKCDIRKETEWGTTQH